ncbi:hypothetical protein GA0115254_12019 [Streptomyces sp. Ncost-T10-10d]|nr:hypothetical protein GA0115254_12019 [Streptomyces sp. Ncost-T10-10d]
MSVIMELRRSVITGEACARSSGKLTDLRINSRRCCPSVPRSIRPQPLVSAVGLAADLIELGEIVVGQRESRAGDVLAQVCHR